MCITEEFIKRCKAFHLRCRVVSEMKAAKEN